ncbi:MAG: proteophosphoglycan precursor [Pseudomonadales bacterium]|jgi:uncharacterized protein|uniref:DUF1285 domain-containing protein n=1 Tax=Halopseudomonas TaxID=2901189 RepID=UPI000C4E0103|nr:DUF1285 domain-containing protein [Halopseudomonas aestusnigri]MAD27867.1 proteophosphoglycan precursor [Pseudomonadales bacterium]HBT57064.1 DUF1285 domain-containing protein [Pseudomonas sp.]MAS66959.1 proteophosphoglycan precursor [Pseudomonadales bacterium]MBP75372.1 proteophosphoglycan precursor [Pseudomonadales bacterium]MCK5533249.1 DUF1285 domain-containing protein [Halopseudomonas aestusnigri]|tara:strand:+ start:1287 stop:1868 length:582 start_codon:yes stop_codon:yes gene_type:complete
MSDRAPPPQSLLNSLPQRGELQRREPAPVHLWNPPLSGEMDMRIARDGTWYHEGEPIRRLALAQLFSTILRLDQDARYYLVTPVERWAIQVDDAPFVAVRLSVSGEGEQQQLLFHTSLEDEVPLDGEHPLRVELDPQSGEPSPYIRVRANLDALISRTVFYELADLAVEAEVAGVQRIGVWSGGRFFPIDGAD